MTDDGSINRRTVFVVTVAAASGATAAGVAWAAATPPLTTHPQPAAPTAPTAVAAVTPRLVQQLHAAQTAMRQVRNDIVRLSREAESLPRAHAGATLPAATGPAYVPLAVPVAPAAPIQQAVAPAAPPTQTTTGASGATVH